MKDVMVCGNCGGKLKKSFSTYKSMKFEAYQCTSCKEKLFTEDQAMHVARTIQARRMREEYSKKPMKVGSSWGFTFPKEMADAFQLNNPETTFTLHPDLEHNRIEIRVGKG
ncbi:MAG: hypothetical protein ABIA93_00660 [Candidatus Woesearchaeota archaeon]